MVCTHQVAPELSSDSGRPRPGRSPAETLRRSRFLTLIPAGDQAAGNDLRLDFGRALEDVEDAGVAEDPADRIFEGIAVAAMDLQGVVGVRPGDARGEQF